MKKLLILFFIAVSIFAQQPSKLYVVKGSAKLMQGEIIRRSDENRDVNGQLAAGLVITSDISGLSYNCYNGFVKDVKHRGPGEDLLFLSPNERVVEIYKTGYLKLQIILSDYGIHLKSGRVWQIKITGDKKLDLVPVTITTKPTNVKKFIDGRFMGEKETFKIKKGNHKIILEKEGFETMEKNVNVGMDNFYFKFNLIKKGKIRLNINSNVNNFALQIWNYKKLIMDIVFDGQKIDLDEERYVLKIKKIGYEDLIRKLNLKNSSSEYFINISLKKIPVPAIIEKPSSPPNGFIFVRGGWFFFSEKKIPVFIQSFLIGKYEVTNKEFSRYLESQNFTQSNDNELPATNISWLEAKKYAKSVGGRLPTEAEWEYAAGGGKQKLTTKYAGSNIPDEVAYYFENADKKMPIGRKKPNKIGLYDMSGNVFEWVEDSYVNNIRIKKNSINPVDDKVNGKVVLKGGAYNTSQVECEITSRNWSYYTDKKENIGFRVIIPLNKKTKNKLGG